MITYIQKALYAAGLFTAILLFTLSAAASRQQIIQQKLRPEIIRFHILAESDSTQDQALKLKVRDSLLAELPHILAGCTTKAESQQALVQNMPALKALAEDTLLANGCTLPVTVEIGESYFPAKRYGSLMLPPGEYDALRVKIGSAGGHNWWCMLYPALCFVEGSFQLEKETALGQWDGVLDENEFDAIWQDNATKVQVRFWLWDKLQELCSP